MKTLYYVYLEDEDVGEVEGMFNEKGEQIGAWSNNDANWRTEYFSPFMRELGFEIVDGTPEMAEALKASFMRTQ